jgi:hypothetical protein
LLCTAASCGALAPVRRYAQVEEVGLMLVEDAQSVLAHADALAVFWDGCDGEGPALAAAARKQGRPARLIRVPGGEVAHLPLWDDLLLTGD